MVYLFFFKQKTAYEMRISDWSSDVCSSDLAQALRAMAARLQQNKAVLQAENARDLAAAEKNQLAPALLDRLKLSDKAIETMAAGLLQIADMPDPIGSQTATAIRPNGMRVAQMRVPLGVIGILYESRPHVTIGATSLCLKSGHATIDRK